MQWVERELFESSLRSARNVLELLGQPPQTAQAAVEKFRQPNLELFEQMYPNHKDRAKVIAVAKQRRLQLEAWMAEEREQLAGGRLAVRRTKIVTK